MLLEQKLPNSYDELISRRGAGSSSETDKVQSLNQSLQPVVESIAKEWPGYGMGYYSTDQKIVALVPFNKDLLGKPASPEAMKVYEEKKLVVTEIENGFTWGSGTNLLSANYPVFHDGVLIGHVWANIQTKSLDSSFIQAIREKALEYLVFWTVLILIIGWALSKFDRKITELIDQITNDTVDVNKFTEIPELTSVLATIESLKNQVKEEYEERVRVKEEISQLDRLNTVAEMAATLAHEIRNPMTVVMGYAQLISRKNNTFTEEFSIIIEELKRADTIIEDFLSLSRNKARTVKEEQINDIIHSFYPLLLAGAVNKRITIEIELQPNLPRIHANKTEITQLVLNLVRNSIEVMNASGKVIISTHWVKNEEYLTLVISDTGCGIAEEDFPNIFNAFFTTKANGTGLGLSVCKKIVDKHQGKITFNSKLGEGTTFTISLPVIQTETLDTPGKDPAGEPGSKPSG